MANQLKMAVVQTILTLHKSGYSNRKIAELTGVHRETVARYVAQADSENRPNAPTGSAEDNPPPTPPASGPVSACEPHREVIEAKLEQGLSAQRIWQDLIAEHEFTGSYYSVRRFAKRLREKHELPFRRIEVDPGEETQVDFGTGAPVITADGKRRRPWVFRFILSHSRKGYSESVYRQTTDNFIACLENAFHYFGGVPKRVVIDRRPRGYERPTPRTLKHCICSDKRIVLRTKFACKSWQRLSSNNKYSHRLHLKPVVA